VSAREQYKWLAEVLTREESARLAEFLGLQGSLVPR
jgi:hypothetical protein